MKSPRVFLLVICLMAGRCHATKDVGVTCWRDLTTREVTMTMNIQLTGELAGFCGPTNMTDYNKSPSVISHLPCTTTYNSTGGIYSVQSIYKESDSTSTNPCGMEKSLDANSNPVYTWYIMHLERYSAGLLGANDRIYRVQCTSTNTLNNTLKATITASTPDLNVNITPSALPVTLLVYLRDSLGQYSQVVANQKVQAGSLVHLKLEYDRGSIASYNEQLHVFGVSAYNTWAGSSMSFIENDSMFDANGCPVSSGPNKPPFSASQGYRGAVVGTKYVQTTGDFYIWRYDQTSDMVYFKTNFDLCFFASTSRCSDRCAAATGRRRRAIDPDVPREVITSVHVYDRDDGEKHEKAEASFDMMYMVIGAIIGVLLLASILLLVTVRMWHRDHANRKLGAKDVYAGELDRKCAQF